MDHSTTYLGHLVAGRDPGDIDDWVERWHEGGTGCELREYLGFTPDEMRSWVFAPETLDLIAQLHRDPGDEALALRISETTEMAWAGIAGTIAKDTGSLN